MNKLVWKPILHIPIESVKAPWSLQLHEVVSQVEVGDILTVEEMLRNLLKAVTREVNGAESLGHHLNGVKEKCHLSYSSECLLPSKGRNAIYTKRC